MPVGQFLGEKAKYQYENDAGGIYVILRDVTLATDAGLALVASDPATDPAGAAPAPRNFKPRGVYWQANDDTDVPGARKFLICGTPLATLYATTSRTPLVVDEIPGVITGRRGETLSF